MAVGKSKYLVTLYLHELKQPSDRVISGGPLILTVHFALPKQLINLNQFKLIQQNRQQALRAYCPTIYTVLSESYLHSKCQYQLSDELNSHFI